MLGASGCRPQSIRRRGDPKASVRSAQKVCCRRLSRSRVLKVLQYRIIINVAKPFSNEPYFHTPRIMLSCDCVSLRSACLTHPLIWQLRAVDGLGDAVYLCTWPADWLAGWLATWLAGYLAGRPAGYLSRDYPLSTYSLLLLHVLSQRSWCAVPGLR